MQGTLSPLQRTVRLLGVVMATVVLAVVAYADDPPGRGGESPVPTMTAPSLPLYLYNQGITAVQAKEWAKARELFEAVLLAAHLSEDDRGIGLGLQGVGFVHQGLQEYPQALEALSTALPHLISTKDLAAQEWTLLNIGAVHVQMGHDADAIDAFDQAFAMRETRPGWASEQANEQVKWPSVWVWIDILMRQKAEAHRRLEQWSQAVESLRQAATDYQILESPRGAGMALWGAAQIARVNMGSPQQALELYTEALALLQAAGDVAAATLVRMDLGVAYLDARDVEQAVAVVTEAIKVAEREGLSKLVPMGYLILGDALQRRGEFEQALMQFQTALQWLKADNQEAKRTEEMRLEAVILFGKGMAARTIDRYEEAIEAFWAAAAKYRDVRDTTSEALVLTHLAEVFFELGDYTAASQYYQQALEGYKAVSNLPKQVEVLTALGEVGAVSRGMSTDAVMHYFQAGRQLLGSFEGTARVSQTLLGEAIRSQDWWAKQEEVIQLLRNRQKTMPSLTSEHLMAAGALYQIWGRYLLETGQPQGAIVVLWLAYVYHVSVEDRNATIELHKDFFWLAQAYHQIAAPNASPLSLPILRGVEENGTRLRIPGTYKVYPALARAYADLGDVDNAVRYYQLGLTKLESVQSQQGSEEYKIGVVEGVVPAYRDLVALLLDLYRKTEQEQYLLEAFHLNERMRAQAFLEMMGKAQATRHGGALGKLSTQAEDIRRQVARIHQRLRYTTLESAEETRLLDQLELLRESWRTLQRDAVQQSPRYAQLGAPHSVTVQEVQSVLDPTTALLEYTITPQRLTLWVITTDAVHAYSLPDQQSLSTVETFLKTLREPLMGADEIAQHVALGQALYAALVGPAALQLQGKKHLIIAPDGSLYYLPFEALILPDASRGTRPARTLAKLPYLVKAFQVSYTPSASVFVQQRQAKGRRGPQAPLPLLAFGDPIYDAEVMRQSPESLIRHITPLQLRGVRLTRLAFAGNEVRRIARIWGVSLHSPSIHLRAQASLDRLRHIDLSQYRLIHFATHGIMNDEVRWATQPALVLAQNKGAGNTESLLQFADILDLKLHAELVVLSACNTGLGAFRLGEGLVGFTRAFLYAGASAVVASLWQVEDQSTALLMERFYRRLKQGANKAEALRQAKLEVLRMTVNLQATGTRQSLAAPFYWAPFILVGEGD